MEIPLAIHGLPSQPFLRPATAVDSIDGVAPRWVAEPLSTEQVVDLLKFCNNAGLRVIPRGSGSKIDWGNPPRALDLVLSTQRLNTVIEHAAGDLTATVQAGCTVETLTDCLAQRGQRLALDPLWPHRATVGGIIATHDSGALRAAYGTLRDHLIGITVVLPDGTIARSGGKVVKNVAGYDLPKLFTGSFGTLGVIIQATFRLYSIPHAGQTIRLIVPNIKSLARLIDGLMLLSLVTLAVQLEVQAQGPITVSILIGGISDAMNDKLQRILHLATECTAQSIDPPTDTWQARENLFTTPDICIAQLSLLPTNWPAFIQRLRDLATSGGWTWSLVAQIAGVGTIQFAGPRLVDTVKTIRAEIQAIGGSLTILRCPLKMKSQINVWPDVGSALPLMRQIKQQFDPHGTLAPGRFVGGI